MNKGQLYNNYLTRYDDPNQEIRLVDHMGYVSYLKMSYAQYLPKDQSSSILELGAGYGFFQYFKKVRFLGIFTESICCNPFSSGKLPKGFDQEIHELYIIEKRYWFRSNKFHLKYRKKRGRSSIGRISACQVEGAGS